MAESSFRVIIKSFDDNEIDDLIALVADLLEVEEVEAEDLLEDLPLTVARDLDEDQADELVDQLADMGAKVRLVEVESRRRRRPRPRRRGKPPAPVRASREEDDELEDDDDFDDDFDDDEELDREGEEERPGRREKPVSQRTMYIFGGVFLTVLIALLAASVFGGGSFIGCGNRFRGPGADEGLTRVLPHVAKRFARGFEPELEPAHGNLGPNSSESMREDIDGGRCYAWIGLSPDGTDLDLYLRDGSNVLAYDDGEDNFPVVRHCVAEDTHLNVEIKMFQGGGDWVLQRYALKGPPGADLLTLMHGLYASMFVANGEPVGAAKRITLQAGEEREIPIEASSDWCYLPLAVTEPGTDLDMALIDPTGREVERDEATDNYPVVRHCPTKSGTYKVRLIMYRGQSDAIYQVFRGKLGSAIQPGQGVKQPAP